MVTLVMLHGWSVTSAETYGGLPEALAARAADAGLELDIRNIHLGEYISFHDEVRVDDLARAMDAALRKDVFGAELQGQPADAPLPPFACITHSTGGPLARRWADLFYGTARIADCPMQHLVMLAPANHGSALAAIGKQRVGRLNAWRQGVEPGQGVLDWLSLGSDEAFLLQENTLHYPDPQQSFFTFVLSGETIDRAFYDFLNSYLKEAGSDGVVRLAGANMNYAFIRLVQRATLLSAFSPGANPDDLAITELVMQPVPGLPPKPDGSLFHSPYASPFLVVLNASHSGDKIGIMNSVTPDNASNKPQVAAILECLNVQTAPQYAALRERYVAATNSNQVYEKLRSKSHYSRYTMLIFRITDDQGRRIDDYDLLLLGEDYHPQLPKGVVIDRQMNAASSALVYYIDCDALGQIPQFGIRVVARPAIGAGFAGYMAAEYRIENTAGSSPLPPNQTLYIDIVLRRLVNRNATRFWPAQPRRKSFKDTEPDNGPYLD